MARMTVRDFARSVGLTTSGADYIACTVMLKVLCSKGVAKEVDRINTSSSGRGRKSVVYEIPEQVSFALDLNPVVAEEPVEETTEEVTTEEVSTEVEETVATEVAEQEVAAEVVEEEVTVALPVASEFFYDDDDEDEDEAEAA